jgi:radical SAM superfamily enzyme with C-terminal helix-hairpin-helix motif
MKILLIDGYIDEPSCLGVPPFLAPLPRYIYGAIKSTKFNHGIKYITVDQFRQQIKPQRNYSSSYRPQSDISPFKEYQIIIIITGVSVPGKYLGGKPIKFSELKRYGKLFEEKFKILCGPATKYGIGEEGGKPSIPVEKVIENFDLIIKEKPETVIFNILNEEIDDITDLKKFSQDNDQSENFLSDYYENIDNFSQQGSELISQHPNYNDVDGGNLICEIETYIGCPRFKSGGCSFCIETQKGKTVHRQPNSIINEIKSLYETGVRHFRIGNQTDFYAYMHGEYNNPRYPCPNPEAIENLLSKIRKNCPNLKTLHIDNVNALNFALYPDQAIKITKSIVKYCTPGNIAAIGVESVDSMVISKNNLKCSSDEIFSAVKMINDLGKETGENGLPKYLPGLNFIMGLPGETKQTLDDNYIFLKRILDANLLLRRINLRKYLHTSSKSTVSDTNPRKVQKHLNKFTSLYFHWKKKIREKIDMPMLKNIFSIGRVIKDVYAEKIDGGTLCRQVGTYPITCFVPKILPLKNFYDVVVINHGFRSIVCLPTPVKLINLSRKELEAIDGIGKKRAVSIMQKQPSTRKEWLAIITLELFETLVSSNIIQVVK